MCGISPGGVSFRRFFGSRFSTQISMRLCIDFGSQIDLKMGPKSLKNLLLFSRCAASVFFRPRFASFSCFFIVCWNAHLHFSLENRRFFNVFSLYDRSRRQRHRVAFSPSAVSKKRLKIDQKSPPKHQTKLLRKFTLFFNEFLMENGSKLEPKIDQKSSQRGVGHWPNQGFRV